MKNTDPKTSLDSLVDFIGLPYDKYDCWAICKMFHKKFFNRELIAWFDYANLSTEQGSRPWAEESGKLVNSVKGHFEKVSDPQFGDIILLKIFGHNAHVAIYLNRTTMLHTDKKNGCVIERVSRWSRLIEGYYRYVKV